ncbi:MAG: helix-turn-helix domain-containing protein, partial [Gallionellaceae bacterium]
EIALIGNEGMYDITRVLGGVGMPYLASAETTGHAFIMDSGFLKHEIDHDDSTQHTLLLYAQALFTQMAQGAVCNRHHSLSQQLCLLLVLIHDKSLSGDLLLTQETIAHMMGVRREDVTRAAVKLRNSGLIDYKRGHITVLDRDELEKQCCECYDVVKNEFKRLLGY